MDRAKCSSVELYQKSDKMNPSAVSFLDLPAEIQNMVYGAAYRTVNTVTSCFAIRRKFKDKKDQTKISDIFHTFPEHDELERLDAPEVEENESDCWEGCGGSTADSHGRCWNCTRGNFGNLLFVSKQTYNEALGIAYNSTKFSLIYQDDVIGLMRAMRSHGRGHLLKRLELTYSMADGSQDMEDTIERLRPGVLQKEFPNLVKLSLKFSQGTIRVRGDSNIDFETFADEWQFHRVHQAMLDLSKQTSGYGTRLQVRVSGLKCPELADSVVACVSSGEFLVPWNLSLLVSYATDDYDWDQDLWHKRDRLRGLFEDEMTMDEEKWAREYDNWCVDHESETSDRNSNDPGISVN